MRLLIAGLLIGVVLAACGGGNGGSSPSPSSVSPAATASPTAGENPDVVACGDDLPAGEVAFQGRVESVESLGEGTEQYQRIVSVSVDRISAEPDAAVYTVDAYVPGIVLPVVLLGDRFPDLRVGDCVIGTGMVRRYEGACAYAICDAAGFVAEKFDVANQ